MEAGSSTVSKRFSGKGHGTRICHFRRSRNIREGVEKAPLDHGASFPRSKDIVPFGKQTLKRLC
jgi:hypothetical protein